MRGPVRQVGIQPRLVGMVQHIHHVRAAHAQRIVQAGVVEAARLQVDDALFGMRPSCLPWCRTRWRRSDRSSRRPVPGRRPRGRSTACTCRRCRPSSRCAARRTGSRPRSSRSRCSFPGGNPRCRWCTARWRPAPGRLSGSPGLRSACSRPCGSATPGCRRCFRVRQNASPSTIAASGRSDCRRRRWFSPTSSRRSFHSMHAVWQALQPMHFDTSISLATVPVTGVLACGDGVGGGGQAPDIQGLQCHY